MFGRKKRANSSDTSGLLQTSTVVLKQDVEGPRPPETEESAGTPQIVDLSPTKHWTTTVITEDEVSVDCRCGWRQVIAVEDPTMPFPERVGVAVREGRRHVDAMIPEA